MALRDSSPPVSRAPAPHSSEFLPFWVCNRYISWHMYGDWHGKIFCTMTTYTSPPAGGVETKALPLILYVLVFWNFYKLRLDKSNEDIYKPLLKRLLPNREIISYWHWKIGWSNQAWGCGSSFSGHLQANRRKVVSILLLISLIPISIKPKGGQGQLCLEAL